MDDKTITNTKYVASKTDEHVLCYDKCKTCRYGTKLNCAVVIDGKSKPIYECNYILIKHQMRKSDPKNCDKYESKGNKGAYRMPPLKFSYEYTNN